MAEREERRIFGSSSEVGTRREEVTGRREGVDLRMRRGGRSGEMEEGFVEKGRRCGNKGTKRVMGMVELGAEEMMAENDIERHRQRWLSWDGGLGCPHHIQIAKWRAPLILADQ